MWQNSSELLDYALREIQAAIDNGKEEVEIVLKEYCKKDIQQIREIDNRLEIKSLTEIIRKKFCNYNIKSVVGFKGHLQLAISYMNSPCDLFYPLAWKLRITNK